ncbi:hypothetical protein PMAYCL1PPCAC_06580 [Pristionchus mayeri]|uniref:Collagen n=1 Tax=Pristionchus mayeri TaxID=1317129 RepID=A0AAN4ZEV6_9BILA|nr:hypothetical protein PMAYCL1PPCAC_06580 [Pristionchus mayeri]
MNSTNNSKIEELARLKRIIIGAVSVGCSSLLLIIFISITTQLSVQRIGSVLEEDLRYCKAGNEKIGSFVQAAYQIMGVARIKRDAGIPSNDTQKGDNSTVLQPIKDVNVTIVAPNATAATPNITVATPTVTVPARNVPVTVPTIAVAAPCSCGIGPAGDPGEPGVDGNDGLDGRPGNDGGAGEDYQGEYKGGNEEWCFTCLQAPAGRPGRPGYPGRPGMDGEMGEAGRDGRSRRGNPGIHFLIVNTMALVPNRLFHISFWSSLWVPFECKNQIYDRSNWSSEHGFLAMERSGEIGFPGQAGAPGYMGPPGNKGPSGLVVRVNGPFGVRGFPGRNGEKGVRGENGLNGKDGKDGFPGEEGEKGNRGHPGRDGQDGSRGWPGRQGAEGSCSHCVQRRPVYQASHQSPRVSYSSSGVPYSSYSSSAYTTVNPPAAEPPTNSYGGRRYLQ